MCKVIFGFASLIFGSAVLNFSLVSGCAEIHPNELSLASLISSRHSNATVSSFE